MGRGSSKAGGGHGGSLMSEIPKDVQLAMLQQELSEAKGLLAKARIKTQIEMLENDFKGTAAEWNQRKAEAREKAVAESRAKQEREKAERAAKEERARQELETELRTQPIEKVEQFQIIQEHNPMRDDYHVGIRKPSDIKTWEEVVREDSADGESFAWGDFSRADANKALETGKIKIYSSYNIGQGVFVSTSKVQAEQYAGGTGNKVFSKIVDIRDVAWINGDEGQYAKRKRGKRS